jgi:hypothetical protein
LTAYGNSHASEVRRIVLDYRLGEALLKRSHVSRSNRDLLDLDLLTTSRMTSSGSGLSTGTEWCLWTGRILIAVHASGRQGTAIVPTPVFRAATDG